MKTFQYHIVHEMNNNQRAALKRLDD